MPESLEDRFQNLHEFIKAARTNLNRNVWDYLIGASETETTVARNRLALDSLGFRPRVLCDVSEIDCSTSLFGRKLRIPVLLAPVGSLESFEPGVRVLTKGRGDYWKPNRGNFDSVELRYIPDSAARTQALISGQIDAGNRLDAKTVSLVMKAPTVNVVRSKGTGNRFAFVADLGIDKVMIYRYGAGSGSLVPNDPSSVSVKPGAGPRQRSSIRRRGMAGASSVSPAQAARMAPVSCSRVASLSRKPLAPAFMAW